MQILGVLVMIFEPQVCNQCQFLYRIQMKIEKETLFRFLRRLNKELSNKFVDLKGDFQKNPPPNSQIRKRFMDWRSRYDQVVISTLKEVQEIDEKNFSFKDYIVKATEEFGSDTQFLDLIKNVNTAIETLKDFIRINLIRDPSIYEVKE